MRFHGVLLACGVALAATASGAEFPEGLRTPLANEVQDLLSDKNYQAILPNGNVWRVDYKSNGYLFFVSGGFTDSGKWRAEDGRMCFQMSKSGTGCNDVRVGEGAMYVKRANGEILKYVRR